MTDQGHTKPQRDALLSAGKIMTVILQAIIGFALVVLTIALPVILFNTDQVATSLAENGSDASLPMILAMIVVLLLLAIAVIAIAFHFFQLLGRIIDTVSEGEPFTEINAQRLNRMGWIALIFQLASFPIGALATYLAVQFPTEDITADIEFSLTGVLLAIVLFILARVFRHGAAIRDDLEGTV